MAAKSKDKLIAALRIVQSVHLGHDAETGYLFVDLERCKQIALS